MPSPSGGDAPKDDYQPPPQSENPFSAPDLIKQLEERKKNVRNIMQELFGDEKKKDD